MLRDRESLIRFVESGETPEYVLFWSAGEGIGPHVFSQWFFSNFTVGGVTFPTAEHCMMFNKATLMGDEDAKRAILRDIEDGGLTGLPDPARAKKIGRSIKPWNQARWDEFKFAVVVDVNMAKFDQNAALREYILSTGESILVEASPYDRIWGIGLGENDPRCRDPRKWQGENLLGFALMEVRDRLRSHPSTYRQ